MYLRGYMEEEDMTEEHERPTEISVEANVQRYVAGDRDGETIQEE